MHLLHVFGIAGALTGRIGRRDSRTDSRGAIGRCPDGNGAQFEDSRGIARRAVASIMLFSGTSVRSSSHSSQLKSFLPSSPDSLPAGLLGGKPDAVRSRASNAGLHIVGPSLRVARNPLRLALLEARNVPSASPTAAAAPL